MPSTEPHPPLDLLHPLLAFTLGSFSAFSAALIYRSHIRRVRSGDWVTPRLLQRRKGVWGVVTSVGDADNFHLFHTPALAGYTWPFKWRNIPSESKDLKNETIHIRIAGVDAPEASHFGKPSQPHAAESLAWLRARILHRRVRCTLLRRDQYGRIVAQVHLPRLLPLIFIPSKRDDLSAEMVRSGMACVYTQANAEYGSLGKDAYLRLEADARSARRGLWASMSTSNNNNNNGGVVLPSEYKRMWAAGAGAGSGNGNGARGVGNAKSNSSSSFSSKFNTSTTATREKGKGTSWLGRIFKFGRR